MAEEGFRLPASSYEELAKIIMGYGNHPTQSTPDDISRLTRIHPTSISRNNAFLVATGIIEGGKKKLCTDKGRALARALEHEMPDDIQLHWRNVVLENEFLEKLVAAVRIRKGMDQATLKSHVAYSAGLPKKSEVMTGAATVVDILRASGLIKEDDGKLIASSAEQLSSPGTPVISQPNYPQSSPSLASEVIHNSPLPYAHGSEGVSLTIQLQIQCTAADIENLGPKLRTLLKEISASPDMVAIGSEQSNNSPSGREISADADNKSTSDDSEPGWNNGSSLFTNEPNSAG